MKNQIQVRPAQAEDKDAILAFCQNTFSWGDYIPNVWDIWFADPNGQLFVGVIQQQPVGMMHVAFLENDAVWLQGMRVHPQFRRRGVGTAIDAEGRAFARARGCRVARLATSIKNIPAHKSLAAQGYTRIAQFNEWEAKPARKNFSNAHIATPTDAPEILARWRASPVRAASRALLPTREWCWTDLTQARLRERIAAGEVRLLPGGFALLPAFDEKNWSAMSLHALVGDAETVRALALAARGEARYRGYTNLEAIVVDHAPLNDALQRAGYRRQGGMFIYEQVL